MYYYLGISGVWGGGRGGGGGSGGMTCWHRLQDSPPPSVCPLQHSWNSQLTGDPAVREQKGEGRREKEVEITKYPQ